MNKDDYKVMAADIVDDFCNYSFTITEGVNIGFTHGTKGKGIIDDDLKDAFKKLHVHLAVIDQAFKLSKTEILDIDKMHNHELVAPYRVTGFKLKGKEDNLGVILIGTKFIPGGHINLDTPKFVFDQFSGHKYWSELQQAIEEIREEVKLYNEGKFTVPETEVPIKVKANPKQMKLTDGAEEAAPAKKVKKVDFDKAKVK